MKMTKLLLLTGVLHVPTLMLYGTTSPGATTGGATANPKPTEYFAGWKVWVSTWYATTPDGSPIEGRGIPPDVFVPWSAAGGRDPVITAAVALAKLAASMGAGISSLLLGAGLVTIGFGVLASFAQTDLRRLLAYSAVAHAGFLAVAAGSPQGGGEAVRFYLVCYAATAGLAFAAVAGTGTEGFQIGRAHV